VVINSEGEPKFTDGKEALFSAKDRKREFAEVFKDGTRLRGE